MLAEQGWIKNVPYLAQGLHSVLLDKVLKMRDGGKVIYPAQSEIFKAFELTSFEQVNVIIVGQDPYHGSGQATGLAFSVNNNVAIPPSLRNIFVEIKSDFKLDNYTSSQDLERWAMQGVFLLNTVLTVEDKKAQSHQNMGWQELTYAVLEALGQRKKPLAVLLWGNSAKQFKPLFMNNGHFILMAAHPSPLSAYRGFFGCKHFSMVNSWLVKQNLSTIKW